jgi:DNA mismatch repair ATPase MutS
MNLERGLMRAVGSSAALALNLHSLTCIDGIGLACGIFEYLLNRQSPAKVIAATHFHEIFENSFLARRPQLQLGHMEVQVSEEFEEVADQITYLYKYVQQH